MQLNDENKVYNGDIYIGCGICAYLHPKQAILLKEKEMIVRFFPPKDKLIPNN